MVTGGPIALESVIIVMGCMDMVFWALIYVRMYVFTYVESERVVE